MAVDVTMPQMGESVVEGTVTKWLVREGDKVSEDQPLAEISTDKVDTEIPSPAAGVIAKIVADEGQTLPIGATLAVIETSGASASAQAPPPSAAEPKITTTRTERPQPAGKIAKASASRVTVAAAKQTNGPMVRTQPAEKPGPETASRAKPADRPVSVMPPMPQAPLKRPMPPRETLAAGVRYSPLVLKMAAEYEVDLGKIDGTGLGGRVTKRDLLRHLESSGQAPLAEAEPAAAPSVRTELERAPARPGPPVPPAGPPVFKAPIYQPVDGDIVEPFSRRRKLIAEHMVFSKTHSPHVPTLAEVDMSRIAGIREARKESFRQREGFGLQFLPFVAAATARVLKEFPRMNASVVNDALVIRKDVNLGIAVDTDEGLLVPVIRGADRMSVAQIARGIDAMARKAAERKITADDLSGGSFTLSNPGRQGNLFGFAIINQPQAGVLRMGEIKKRPVVVEFGGEDVIAIRTIMFLTLSYDHRVIDGVLGNRFLFRVGKILEEGNFEV